MYAGGFKLDVYIAMGVRWGIKMDVYIAMGVRWGVQDGCVHVHSYECTLGVSRWMCT